MATPHQAPSGTLAQLQLAFGTPVYLDQGGGGTPVYLDQGGGTPVYLDHHTPVYLDQHGTPAYVDYGTPVYLDHATPVYLDHGTPVYLDHGTSFYLDQGGKGIVEQVGPNTLGEGSDPYGQGQFGGVSPFALATPHQAPSGTLAQLPYGGGNTIYWRDHKSPWQDNKRPQEDGTFPGHPHSDF